MDHETAAHDAVPAVEAGDVIGVVVNDFAISLSKEPFDVSNVAAPPELSVLTMGSTLGVPVATGVGAFKVDITELIDVEAMESIEEKRCRDIVRLDAERATASHFTQVEGAEEIVFSNESACCVASF